MSRLSDCMNLEDLAQQFQGRVAMLRQGVHLRDANQDPSCAALIAVLSKGLNDLTMLLALMRADLSQRKKAMTEMKDVRAICSELTGRMDHCRDNIPERMPRPKPQVPAAVVSQTRQIGISPPEPPSARAAASVSKPRSTSVAPALDYLTVDEFQSVPKYMRGRIKYEQMNIGVDEFNKALAAKRAIITTPRSGQSDQIRKKIQAYKEQHTNDTKGIHFLIEADLKEYSNFKMDAHGRAMLTILRHCQRIREIRSKGLVRYACM